MAGLSKREKLAALDQKIAALEQKVRARKAGGAAAPSGDSIPRMAWEKPEGLLPAQPVYRAQGRDQNKSTMAAAPEPGILSRFRGPLDQAFRDVGGAVGSIAKGLGHAAGEVLDVPRAMFNASVPDQFFPRGVPVVPRVTLGESKPVGHEVGDVVRTGIGFTPPGVVLAAAGMPAERRKAMAREGNWVGVENAGRTPTGEEVVLGGLAALPLVHRGASGGAAYSRHIARDSMPSWDLPGAAPDVGPRPLRSQLEVTGALDVPRRPPVPETSFEQTAPRPLLGVGEAPGAPLGSEVSIVYREPPPSGSRNTEPMAVPRSTEFPKTVPTARELAMQPTPLKTAAEIAAERARKGEFDQTAPEPAPEWTNQPDPLVLPEQPGEITPRPIPDATEPILMMPSGRALGGNVPEVTAAFNPESLVQRTAKAEAEGLGETQYPLRPPEIDAPPPPVDRFAPSEAPAAPQTPAPPSSRPSLPIPKGVGPAVGAGAKGKRDEALVREGKAKKGKKGGRPPPSRPEAGSAREGQHSPPSPESGLNPNARLPTGGRGAQFDAMTTNLQSPQFNEFLGQTGLVERTYREGVQKRRLLDEYETEVAGSKDRQVEMEDYFEENPQASRIAIKIREGRELTPEEQAFHAEHSSEYMPYAEKFFGLLDRARNEILPRARLRGIDVGDQGPNYFPRSYSTIGDAIMALGEGWRERFREPRFAEMVLPNLERARTSDVTPPMNLAKAGRSYMEQLADAETMKPLSRDASQLSKHWRDRGLRDEAEAVEAYGRANIIRTHDPIDLQYLNRQLIEISQEQVRPGDTFVSNGRWLPEGEIKILDQQKNGRYRIQVEGEPEPRIVNEVDIMGAKHGGKPMFNAITRGVDALNKLSSTIAVGGRLKSFFTSAFSNVARTAISEAPANLRHGIDIFRKKPSPELVKEWEAQGIVDNSFRTVSESFDGTRMATWERWYFANVRLPDQWSKIIIYEARKKGLRRAHPEWSEQQIRDKAGLWTAKFSDMTVEGFRAAASSSVVGKLTYHLVASPAREAQLILENLRKGDYKAVGAQVSLKAGGIAAIVAATSGDPEDFARGMAEIVPIVGTALTQGDAVSWNAPGIIGERIGNAISGDIPGAMPGSVKQFYAEGGK